MHIRTRTFLVAGLLGVSMTCAAEGGHWGYSGDAGPQNWGKLSAEFSTCENGKNQSPIDLTGTIEANLPPIRFNYRVAANEILNNGHTVQANFAAGNAINLSGKVFELKQVHFHTPSENLIEGKRYPLEAHLVHADKDGNLAVVAVMFEAGQGNAAIGKLWGEMPEGAGVKNALKARINPADLLPISRGYYRFSGSLTTPPCSEGVNWLVMKRPMQVGKDQIERFAAVMHHPNNRPVQAVNARTVLK